MSRKRMVLIFVLVLSSFQLIASLQMIRSDCESLNTVGKVVKEEYEQNTKNLIRICEGKVTLKKCEGKCSSYLQPSFNSPNGFQKNCICCKETKLRRMDHVLKNCFDINGNKLFGQLASMTISIPEPENCKCIRC